LAVPIAHKDLEVSKKKGRPKKAPIADPPTETEPQNDFTARSSRLRKASETKNLSTEMVASSSPQSEVKKLQRRKSQGNVSQSVSIGGETEKDEDSNDLSAEAEDLMKQRGVTVNKEGKLMIPSQKLSLPEELCRVEFDETVRKAVFLNSKF
jgi:hypothetical protein